MRNRKPHDQDESNKIDDHNPNQNQNSKMMMTNKNKMDKEPLLPQQGEEWETTELSLVGKLATKLCDVALDTFFSTIEVVNSENIPGNGEGPVILFANHMNQFLDPMVLMRAAERPVSFIGAAVSLRKPILGQLGRALDVIPVTRPQDNAVLGNGKLVSINLEDRSIIGSGTQFMSECKPGWLIGNSEIGQYLVEQVVSNEKILFKPPSEDVIIHPELLPADGTTYKVVPKINHSEMFAKAHDALVKGKCIGIFPEGGSHDQTQLLELKAGVAIMALNSLSEGIPVTLVPVGLNYFSGHVWRSKVFVDVGKPIVVEPELIDMYKLPHLRKAACAKLLQKMQTGLELVVFSAPDFETLKVIRTASRLYQGNVQLTPKEYIDLKVKFGQAYKLWKDKPEFMQLMEDIAEYLEVCRSQGLKDKQVRDLPPLGSVRTLLNAIFDVFATLGMILILLPLVLPGVLINFPIAIRARHIIPKAMKAAVDGSSVKIAGRDVAASQQVLLTIKMILPLHLFYSTLWLIFFYVAWPTITRGEFGTVGNTLVSNAKWFLPLCFFFLGPYYAFYITPYFLEIANRRARLLPRYLLCIRSFFSNKKRQPAELLRYERKKLMVRVQDLVEKFIGEFPEWDNDRVINRKKVMKQRSKSVKAIAKRGDLEFGLHTSLAIENNLARYSIGSEAELKHGN